MVETPSVYLLVLLGALKWASTRTVVPASQCLDGTAMLLACLQHSDFSWGRCTAENDCLENLSERSRAQMAHTSVATDLVKHVDMSH